MKAIPTQAWALFALALILGTAILFVVNKADDTSLIVVLATGAVTIAQSIAGIKPATPGTTITSTTQPPDPPKEPTI